MARSRDNLLGAYAFLMGVILAIVLGFFQGPASSTGNFAYVLLVILGVIVGFLNVGDKDSMTFLLASLALVIVSSMGQNTLIYLSQIPVLSFINSILSALLVMFVPATIIVALKTVFSIAKV